ncbi:MAG: hypothetical protein H6551_12235 [Chitinophagales bacterium]|nr:hypothetical protein [Chitinophagaceae bacterium]MCB9065898.1 hypothetical protein [Chitinophagales bacterium]
MIGKIVYRFTLFIFFLVIGTPSFAQPALPDIVGATNKGINVLSWSCQYSGLKSIAVQRSSDSVVNFVTIGYVKDLKQGVQAYIDGHPNPGDNWYRLNIAFSSDLTWYSNRIKIYNDSASLLEKGVIPPNDSLQRYASTIKIESNDVVASTFDPKTDATPVYTGNRANADNTRVNTARTPVRSTNATVSSTTPSQPKPTIKLDIPMDQNSNQIGYMKSQYVFTNPFTGHVTLELPQNTRSTYAIRFYEKGNERTPILDVPRIRQKQVIIDKRNFGKKGIYKFILFEGTDKMEEGYITIY